MASDAGEALARRRRDIFVSSSYFRKSLRSIICLVLLFHNLSHLQPFFLGVSMQNNVIDRGSPANPLVLIWNVLWPARSVKEESYLSTCSPFIKSENRLSYNSGSKDLKTFAILVDFCLSPIPLKSKIPPPRLSMEWSSSLTSDLEMALTAEGLDLALPSFHSVASSQHTSGGDPDIFQAGETLGFSLLGLSHCCGPIPLPWPIAENLSPFSNFNKPRFDYSISSASPLTCLSLLYDLSSRYSCPEVVNCIWRCGYSPQTMVLICPLAKVYKLVTWKIMAEILYLKLTSIAYMGIYENQFCLSRRTLLDTSLPVNIYIDYSLKQCEIVSIQRPQPGVVFSSLILLQPSRTMGNHSRKISRMKSRIALLLGLKGPWRPSSSVVERTSAPPSSFVERNQSELLVAPLGLASAIHEAKNPFQTPQNLLIVAIYKIPETFVEVSLTHHSLACGMLLVNLCFRDSMDLSSKLDVYLIYLMYVVSMCFKTLYPMYPLFGLIE